jgi:hypothetical protein
VSSLSVLPQNIHAISLGFSSLTHQPEP